MVKVLADIRTKLSKLQREKLSVYEKEELLVGLKGLISTAWSTDPVRRAAPTPQQEMRAGMGYLADQIYSDLPVFARRVDAALLKQGMDRLPLDKSVITFGNWMGGDRDGNPYVTSTVTREVVYMAKTIATKKYFKSVEDLMFNLSMTKCSAECAERAQAILAAEMKGPAAIAAERQRRGYTDSWKVIDGKLEPYRVILAELRDKLYDTAQALERIVSGVDDQLDMTDPSVIKHKDELLEPLKFCYASLIEVGDSKVANAALLDLIRQAQCFGLTLAKFDIRQESERHSDAIDAITQHYGLGSYNTWDEEKKIEYLAGELENKRPLIPTSGFVCTAEVQEVLDTFKMIGHLQTVCPGSLGIHNISMAETASDILEVMLLQLESGCPPESVMKIAPLFERGDDLNRSPEVLRRLLSVPWYLNKINGVQHIMVGYSDSGKDAGRMAAAWALYEAQEKVTQVAKEFGVSLTMFHGRGGTVGRGGGPAHIAIMSQPGGSISGTMRLTIQGELIEQSFSDLDSTLRTLEMHTAAVLEHTLKPPAGPAQESWREVMTGMALSSSTRYRGIVFKNPDFNPYFGQCSLAAEAGSLNIGSRPAKRKKSPSVGALRAIPWIFAWTQNQFHIPVWLGINTCLQKVIDDGKLETLQQMYQQWPFFKVTLDMVETVLSKANLKIAGYYEQVLVEEKLKKLGGELRGDLAATKTAVLEVTQHGDPLMHPMAKSADGNGTDPVLQKQHGEKWAMRSNYVLPLNILEVAFLQRNREREAADAAGVAYVPTLAWAKQMLTKHPDTYVSSVADTLVIAIKGVAAGMQVTRCYGGTG
jgi:phosphoenolpyruvate carboxylase